METSFKNKYLKYKRKYLNLKNSNQKGGKEVEFLPRYPVPRECIDNKFCGNNSDKVRQDFDALVDYILKGTSSGNDFRVGIPDERTKYKGQFDVDYYEPDKVTFKEGLEKYKTDIFNILEIYNRMSLGGSDFYRSFNYLQERIRQLPKQKGDVKTEEEIKEEKRILQEEKDFQQEKRRFAQYMRKDDWGGGPGDPCKINHQKRKDLKKFKEII